MKQKVKIRFESSTIKAYIKENNLDDVKLIQAISSAEGRLALDDDKSSHKRTGIKVVKGQIHLGNRLNLTYVGANEVALYFSGFDDELVKLEKIFGDFVIMDMPKIFVPWLTKFELKAPAEETPEEEIPEEAPAPDDSKPE